MLKNKRYYKDKENLIRLISKNIFSDGLWDNVGLAIKVALDIGIKPEIIKKTLPKIKFEGRVNYIKGKLTKNKNYKVLVDGCHSDASTKNLANHLRKIKVPIYGIWGCLKNKNPEKLIRNFQGNFKKLVGHDCSKKSAISAFLHFLAKKSSSFFAIFCHFSYF